MKKTIDDKSLEPEERNLAKDLNGKELAAELREEIKRKIEASKEKYGAAPCLAMVLAGEDSSAFAYIKSKQKACKNAGIETRLEQLDESASLRQLEKKLNELNSDPSVHGIILEMPLPPQIPYIDAVSLIAPEKDVDGLNPINLGLLFQGETVFVPNTPMAVMTILESYDIPIAGKNAVIVGRSMAVGKPLYSLLLAENATVTTCHSKTADISKHSLNADILVAAVGKPNMITENMIKQGSIVIDVGINVIDGRIVGDVDYENVRKKASYITPVPGGVGPVTTAMILKNTLRAFESNCRK